MRCSSTSYGGGDPVRLASRIGGMQTRWCRVVDVGDDTREAAWQLFVRYDDHLFSFTDCTSFALTHAMSLQQACTFDRDHFAAAGFTALA